MALSALQEFPCLKYQQEKLFQDDGDAKVLLMRHERRDKVYVVKVVESSKISEYREGLSHEAYMGMKVLDHKRFAKTYKYYVTATLHYLVIEYIEGMELRAFVAQCQGEKIYSDQFKPLLRSYYQAMTYLVRNEIFPRGLHDRNVIVEKDHRVKIIDFEAFMINNDPHRVDSLDMGHRMFEPIRPLFALENVDIGADFKEFQKLTKDYWRTDGWGELGEWVQKVLKHPFLQKEKKA